MCTHIGTEQDKVGTDLESEVNKARFYEKNQDGLHLTFSSTQAESLHHESTVAPAISFLGEPLHPVNPPHSNVPQFIRNHRRRDGVRYRGERHARYR